MNRSTSGNPPLDGEGSPAEVRPVGLAAMQREIDGLMRNWGAAYWQPLALLARLSEEVGEVAREINHLYGEKPKKREEGKTDLGMEMADILFVLGCLANREGIDLDRAFQQTMDKYRTRDVRRWSET